MTAMRRLSPRATPPLPFPSQGLRMTEVRRADTRESEEELKKGYPLVPRKRLTLRFRPLSFESFRNCGRVPFGWRVRTGAPGGEPRICSVSHPRPGRSALSERQKRGLVAASCSRSCRPCRWTALSTAASLRSSSLFQVLTPHDGGVGGEESRERVSSPFRHLPPSTPGTLMNDSESGRASSFLLAES